MNVGLLWQPKDWPKNAGELAEEIALGTVAHLAKFSTRANLALLSTQHEGEFPVLEGASGCLIQYQENVTPYHLFVTRYTE